MPKASLPPYNLEHALTRNLSKLPYAAFVSVAGRLLAELGYVNVKASKRTFFKGRNPTAGIDMTASIKTEFGLEPVVVQLKQYAPSRRVQRLAVDNCKGVIDGAHILHAVILLTTLFAPPAIAAAKALPGEPIRLIDGKELGRLMLKYRLGVAERTDLLTGKRLFVLDPAAFQELADQFTSQQHN